MKPRLHFWGQSFFSMFAPFSIRFHIKMNQFEFYVDENCFFEYEKKTIDLAMNKHKKYWDHKNVARQGNVVHVHVLKCLNKMFVELFKQKYAFGIIKLTKWLWTCMETGFGD